MIFNYSKITPTIFIVGCLFFLTDSIIYMYESINFHSVVYSIGSFFFLICSILWYYELSI